MGGIFTFKIRDRDIWDGMARRLGGGILYLRRAKVDTSGTADPFGTVGISQRQMNGNKFKHKNPYSLCFFQTLKGVYKPNLFQKFFFDLFET